MSLSLSLSLSIERPPPEPSPHVKQISYFGPLDLLQPSTKKFILVPHPSLMLSRVRPPWKSPDKSGNYASFLVY